MTNPTVTVDEHAQSLVFARAEKSASLFLKPEIKP